LEAGYSKVHRDIPEKAQTALNLLDSKSDNIKQTIWSSEKMQECQTEGFSQHFNKAE